MSSCAENLVSTPRPSRDELIGRGMPIVRRLAFSRGRGLPEWFDVNDLVGAGHEGLLEAIERYDPSGGVPFEFYAVNRIRGAILDEVRQQNGLTNYWYKSTAEIAKATHALQRSLGRQPAEAEVAERLGMPLAKYQHLSGNLMQGLKLQGLSSVSAELAASISPTQETTLIDAEQRRLLAYALSKLTSRQQEVLTLYYFDELTQDEIGGILDVDESRVCQILTQAKARLRWWIETLPAWQQATRAAAKTHGPCASPS